MTDFRLVRAPPRLQWRYRSGFEPDSLFSEQSEQSARHLNGLNCLYHTLELRLCQGEFRETVRRKGCRQPVCRGLTVPETMIEYHPQANKRDHSPGFAGGGTECDAPRVGHCDAWRTG